MTGAPENIVIIGSGHAAIELAAALRQHGHAGAVTVIGGEPDLPYQRPPLSKEFLKSSADTGLPLKGEAFFPAQRIELLLGAGAEAIDRAQRRVRLADGRVLAYDHLALATGARNRVPPVPGLDPDRALALRTLSDARALHTRLPELGKVAVIGGGFIGLEVAALLRGRGVAVEVIEATPVLMGRVLSRPMSAWFRAFHDRLGTRLHLETLVERVEHRQRSARLHLSSGEVLDADAVLVAAGIVPNVELAAAAGLAVADGIVVDERLSTADPAVSALGDCAAYPNAFCGRVTRLESVQNAVDQARTLALRLAGGGDEPYRGLPWFWSNQATARLQIAGLGEGHDETVLRGDPESGKFSIFLYRGGRLVAVESVNSPADHMASRRLIAAAASVPPEVARDLTVHLKELL